MYLCVCMWVCIYTRTNVHEYIQTHTHAHISGAKKKARQATEAMAKSAYALMFIHTYKHTLIHTSLRCKKRHDKLLKPWRNLPNIASNQVRTKKVTVQRLWRMLPHRRTRRNQKTRAAVMRTQTSPRQVSTFDLFIFVSVMLRFCCGLLLYVVHLTIECNNFATFSSKVLFIAVMFCSEQPNPCLVFTAWDSVCQWLTFLWSFQ